MRQANGLKGLLPSIEISGVHGSGGAEQGLTAGDCRAGELVSTCLPAMRRFPTSNFQAGACAVFAQLLPLQNKQLWELSWTLHEVVKVLIRV